MSVTWSRVTARVGGHGRTVYWNGAAGEGWRLAVSRVDFEQPGSPWRFAAYRRSPRNRAGEKVYTSEGIGSVTQARRAAEQWVSQALARAS